MLFFVISGAELELDKVSEVIKAHPRILQMHGFYLDDEAKALSFDLVVDFDDPDPMGTVAAIKQETEESCEGYTVFVQYDRDFSLSE